MNVLHIQPHLNVSSQPPLQWQCRRSARPCFRAARTRIRASDSSAPDPDPETPPTRRNGLEVCIRRKQAQIEAQLKELGMEALEQRLQDSVQVPAIPPYRLSTLIAQSAERGRCVLLFEVVRPSPATTTTELVTLAKQLVSLGADALVVPTDAEESPTGLADLFTICQAVKNVPVLAKDWMIHPLQIVEVKQSGAAGVIGVISQVNGRGTAVMSSFSAAVGLDAPVEVVNMLEVEALARAGVVFYGINLCVGLSLPIPGFATDIAHGILGKLPFGSVSMVGVKSVEEARKARSSGADSLLIKRELVDQFNSPTAAAAANDPFAKSGLRRLVEELQMVTCGDD